MPQKWQQVVRGSCHIAQYTRLGGHPRWNAAGSQKKGQRESARAKHKYVHDSNKKQRHAGASGKGSLSEIRGTRRETEKCV